MKRTLLMIIVTFCVLSSNAQMQKGVGFGAKVGMNISDFTSSSGGSAYGLSVGVFADYYFTKTIGLEINAQYNQYGSNNNTLLQIENFPKVNLNFDYATVDLLAKFHLIDGFRVFVGPQFGFLVNGSAKATNGEKRKVDNMNYFQPAIVAGVGYTFNFGLDLQANYMRSIGTMYTDSKHYNYAYTLTVGWRFIGKGGRARSFKQL